MNRLERDIGFMLVVGLLAAGLFLTTGCAQAPSGTAEVATYYGEVRRLEMGDGIVCFVSQTPNYHETAISCLERRAK